MSHKDVLKSLFPLDLGGVFDADLELEGEYLDAAEASADLLLREMLPQSAGDSIADWERVCGIDPDATDTLQMRQARVVAKLRERGGLSIPHFTALAASWGYTIVIEELTAGADGTGDEGIFRWRVIFLATPLYYFRAGQSRAGERLVDGPLATAMEAIFEELKPAHTQVTFAYA